MRLTICAGGPQHSEEAGCCRECVTQVGSPHQLEARVDRGRGSSRAGEGLGKWIEGGVEIEGNAERFKAWQGEQERVEPKLD